MAFPVFGPGQAAIGGFFQGDWHEAADFRHGRNDFIWRDDALDAGQGHFSSRQGFNGKDGIALDTGHFDQARYRIAGQAQRVFACTGQRPGGSYRYRRRPFRPRPLPP